MRDQVQGSWAAKATLGTLVGEPFVMVFKPIVAVIRNAFLAIARFVAAIGNGLLDRINAQIELRGGLAVGRSAFLTTKVNLEGIKDWPPSAAMVILSQTGSNLRQQNQRPLAFESPVRGHILARHGLVAPLRTIQGH